MFVGDMPFLYKNSCFSASKIFFYLVEDIFGCETEFFVKYLVGSRCAESAQTVDFAVEAVY